MKLFFPLALAVLSLGIPVSAYAQAFPLESCGDPALEGKATWYPVYVAHLGLQESQGQLCRDAFATQHRGRSVVQLGSFSDRQRAAIFADQVNGTVGDPYEWGTDSVATLAPVAVPQGGNWDNASEEDILNAYLREFRLSVERTGIPLGNYSRTTFPSQMESASYLCAATETVQQMYKHTTDIVQPYAQYIERNGQVGLLGNSLASLSQVSSFEWSVYNATVAMEDSTQGRFCQVVTRRWRPWELFGTSIDPGCSRGCPLRSDAD